MAKRSAAVLHTGLHSPTVANLPFFVCSVPANGPEAVGEAAVLGFQTFGVDDWDHLGDTASGEDGIVLLITSNCFVIHDVIT